MSTANHLASWYTEEQAAAKLGISARSFQRLIAEGKSNQYSYAPEKRRRPRGNGKKPEPVFNPQDVDQLAQLASTHLVPVANPANPATTGTALAKLAKSSDSKQLQLAKELPPALTFALRLMERMRELSTPADKLYLTIPEAAKVSGLSQSFIRRNASRLGFKDGGTWKIPRTNLANPDRLAKLAKSS
jgi:hypothetical protein